MISKKKTKRSQLTKRINKSKKYMHGGATPPKVPMTGQQMKPSRTAPPPPPPSSQQQPLLQKKKNNLSASSASSTFVPKTVNLLSFEREQNGSIQLNKIRHIQQKTLEQLFSNRLAPVSLKSSSGFRRSSVSSNGSNSSTATTLTTTTNGSRTQFTRQTGHRSAPVAPDSSRRRLGNARQMRWYAGNEQFTFLKNFINRYSDPNKHVSENNAKKFNIIHSKLYTMEDANPPPLKFVKGISTDNTDNNIRQRNTYVNTTHTQFKILEALAKFKINQSQRNATQRNATQRKQPRIN